VGAWEGVSVVNPCELAVSTAGRELDRRVRALRKHVRGAAKHDVDGIHDLRVASRRLRAFLSDHRCLFRKRRWRAVRDRARSVTQGLGKARELDVTIDRLARRRNQLRGPARVAASGVLTRLRKLRREQHASVEASAATAGSKTFATRSARLAKKLNPPSTCYLETAGQSLLRRYDALLADYLAWRDNENEDNLHRVRIAFKKLRYSCERFAPLYGKGMSVFIEKLKIAQESLGNWNDERVLRNYVVELTSVPARANGEGAAQLVQTIEETIAAELERFHRVAESFFSEDACKDMRRFLGAPTKRCCRAPRGQRNGKASQPAKATVPA
jgi:CHAD domain-containing protein